MQEPTGSDDVPLARVWEAPVQPPPVPPPVPLPPPVYPPAYAQPYGTYPNYMGSGYGAGRVGKPAVITTIGILSIIFASFSIIGSGASAFQAMFARAFSRASANMASVNARAASARAAAVAMQTVPVGPSGLDWDDRQTAVTVITARRRLSPNRIAQLDGLLANGGQAILGVQPGAFTSNDVRAAIANTSRGKSLNNTPGPDYIVTTRGTIELYDGNAVFRPDDRSQPVIRAAANPATYALMLQNGGATPPVPGPAVPSGPPPVIASVDPGAITLVLIESGISLLVAIYLLVIGILTLRGSSLGGRLHLVFAVVKLPLIAFAAYASIRLWDSLANSVNSAVVATGGPRMPATGMPFHIGTGVTVVLAAAYPIALLVLLCTKTVRDYYRKPAHA